MTLTTRIAAQVMHSGGVIAYPTEAVWGLGCDPHQAPAVARLLEMKGRHVRKGLILVAACVDQLQPYLGAVSDSHLALLSTPTCRPTTWLVPITRTTPAWICGQHSTVAVRISQHPLVQALCHDFNGAIVSTSANPQGALAPRYPWQVRRYFQRQGQLAGIVKGSCGQHSRPSRIIDLTTACVIRE